MAIIKAPPKQPKSVTIQARVGVGESVKTAQAILGHSDIETTLNTYMHAIPDSQRRAVERVAGVLFPDVPKSPSGEEHSNCLSAEEAKSQLKEVVNRAGLEPATR
jgi:hypothetical protein